jgi:tRNA (guanine37-N1)-methyltransferase
MQYDPQHTTGSILPPWRVHLLTIFPEIFENFLKVSLVGKACARGLFIPSVTNIRDFASPPHFKVDDTPYGGGAGMVLGVEPMVRAIEGAQAQMGHPTAHVVLLSPSGTPLTQTKVRELAQQDNVIVACGRYEGVDHRVVELAVDEEISIGNYVLMGGEVPAMVLIEACLRLRPGVLHNSDSVVHESFSEEGPQGTPFLEGPQYTRPEEFRGIRVPDVLLSGNHKDIARWRKEESKRRTTQRASSRESSDRAGEER